MRNKEQEPSMEEGRENGLNNRILIKIMRHGERTPDKLLTDYGRQVTGDIAKGDKGKLSGIDKIKAVGSDDGPKGATGMARSLETADIYANGITLEEGEGTSDANAKIERYKTKPRPLLEISGMKTSKLFDWTEYYNSKLPENFDQLSDEEKSAASRIANEACLDRLLTDPKGDKYRKEIASRHAVFVNIRLRMVDRIKSNSKIMYPTGAHGGFMEVFLKQVLKRKTKDGQEITGFDKAEDIGGAFKPSEGFFIDITTDEHGEKKVKVIMDDPARLKGEELTLDLEKINELVEYYKNEIRGQDKKAK